jgi:hypothetical protein
VLAEGEALAKLAVAQAAVRVPDDGPPGFRMRVHNGTGRPIVSGFTRLSLDTSRARIYKTEEYVLFEPPLESGQEREVEVRVSRDFARLYLATDDVRPVAEFTSFEGGSAVVEELDPELLERAERALGASREELAELTRKLAAVG